MNPPASPIQKQGKKLYALPKEHLTLQVAMQNKGLDGPLGPELVGHFLCSEGQLDLSVLKAN